MPFEAAPSPSQIPGSTNQGHLAVIKQPSSGNQTWQVKIHFKKKNTFLWEKQSSIYEWIMCRYTVYSVYCKGFPIISIMRFDYKKVFCRIGVKVRWCVLMETYGNLTLGWHHLTMSNSKLFMDQRWSAEAPGLQDWRKSSAMASRNLELRQSASRRMMR